ncbi:sulfatase-like hydrolase/transferase [Geomesophilobacter sediminis]|uniref:Sulfatase-like hydrolase/transferase n=1 Tax=Geomesophilobacter sediminis TaxID=2798584 RepID=A0A8J7S8G9_9BACT|nr:sulfatase-like hydrolase/transferase [Geomesophilobacter sediminis]MBJ6727661.1 sulfatase-like hydrolase/transferase [Geomesophilobacter sediminis]
MPDNSRWRDFVGSVSLANLMFLKLWLKLLPYLPGGNYLAPYSPFNSYLGVMLNVLIWGTFFFGLVRLGRKRERLFPWVALCLFLLVGIAAIYGAGMSVISFTRFIFLFGEKNAVLVEIACWTVAVGAILLFIAQRERVGRLYRVIPLLVAPFLLVTFGRATAALFGMEPAAQFHPHRVERPAPPNALARRVVWVIFDETDYRLCFGERPAGLSLPAFDTFAESSLQATRAYSPSDATQVSLPALLTGIPLKTTEAAGARRLDLVRADTGARVDFSAQENIFDAIRQRHGSSALFGWYHPYARVIRSADLCRDYPRYNFWTSDRLFDVMWHQSLEVWDMRFLPFSNTMLGNNQIGIVTAMQADVLDAVRNRDFGFLFLHYSVPHSPNVYDRRTGRFGFNRNKREGYFDNVILADRLFGELRREMERQGTWDDALVIVSSDHHWRTNTYDGKIDFEHVPFLAKFPGQRHPVVYDSRFNTVLTKGLILATVDGKVRSAEEATVWLDRATRENHLLQGIFSKNQPDAD